MACFTPTCRIELLSPPPFPPPPQVALVDSGMRMHEGDRTAFIYLPGGLGTLVRRLWHCWQRLVGQGHVLTAA